MREEAFSLILEKNEFYLAYSAYLTFFILLLMAYFSFKKGYIRKPIVFNLLLIVWILFRGKSLKLILLGKKLQLGYPSSNAFKVLAFDLPDWLVVVKANLTDMLIALIPTIIAILFISNIKEYSGKGYSTLAINIIMIALLTAYNLLEIFMSSFHFA